MHGYVCVLVWVCNLSGTAGTWSVHLASVQRAAHRIIVTVAAASVLENKWRIKCHKEMEINKQNVCVRTFSRLTDTSGEERLQKGQIWRGRVHKKKRQNKRARGQKAYVLALDYILWSLCVPAADSGLCKKCACLSVSVILFCVLSAAERL